MNDRFEQLNDMQRVSKAKHRTAPSVLEVAVD
jgi:hypothetical protein